MVRVRSRIRLAGGMAMALVLSSCNPLAGSLENSFREDGYRPGWLKARSYATVWESIPSVLRGGQTLVLNFSVASDAVYAVLEFTSDGVSWSPVTALSPVDVSYTWSVPSQSGIDTVLSQLRITTTDSTGLQDQVFSSIFAIDSTLPAAPAITRTSASPTNSLAASLTVASCADRFAIYVSESSATPSLGAAGWQPCTAVSGATSFTVSGTDGTKTLYAFARDEVGNVSSASSAVTLDLDRTSPQLASASVTNPYPTNTTIYDLAYGAVTGTYAAYCILENDTSESNCVYVSGAVPSNHAVTSTQNAKVLSIWLKDSVGNVSTRVDTAPVTLDTEAPQLASATITNSSPTGTTTYSLTYGAVTGTYAGYCILENDTSESNCVYVSGAVPSNYAVTSTQNAKVLSIWLKDTAGNVSTRVDTAAVTLDTTAPAAPSIALTSTTPTNSLAATLTVASCVDRAKILIAESSSAPSSVDPAWQTCTTTAGAVPFTLSSADGTKALYAFAQDDAGNVSAASVSVSVLLDRTAPVISLTALTGGQFISGTTSTSVTWSVSDTGGSNLLASSALIEVSSNGGTNWSSLAAGQTTTGPYAWTPGAGINSTTYRIRVTVSDAAGNVATAESASNFTIDSDAPAIASGQMTINGAASGGATTNNYVRVSLEATDNLTKVTHFCLKYNLTTAPTTADGCWTSISAIGVTPSTAVAIANHSFMLGLGTSLYHVYVWVMDQAQNISELSGGGSGVNGTDEASITYTAPSPPSISGVMATSSMSYSTPLDQTDLTIASGSTVYIQWNVTNAPNGLGSNPISLFYTTDNLTYTPVAGASALVDGANGCTPDGSHSGCYEWNNGSPTNSFFVIRAVVTDQAGITAASSATPLNTWPPINYLAGATDPGTDGSASSAMFASRAGSGTDVQSFVVTSTGIIYFRDQVRGILKVDPVTGNQTVLIPRSVLSYVDGTATGLFTGATVTSPVRLALDFSDRLLIQEVNAIRRYDPADESVATIIGGPSASGTGATTSASTTQVSVEGSTSSLRSSTPLVATPDGRIYFSSQDSVSTPVTGVRNRIYTPGDGMVRSLSFSGSGNEHSASADNSLYKIRQALLGFSGSGDLDVLTPILDLNGIYYSSDFDPATGASLPGPYPAKPSMTGANAVTGMDGEIYYFTPNGNIQRYGKVSRTWTNLAGTGVAGVSANGDPAATSVIMPQDVFVNAAGRVYFFERGVIRFIDQSGNLATLAGASRSSGDGGSALLALISDITDFKLWRDGSDEKIVFVDNVELRIRQFTIGGAMEHIAGNGSTGEPDPLQVATSQPLNWSADGQSSVFTIQVHSTNGTIYTNARHGVDALDPVTQMYTPLVGQGTTSYLLGDGLDGSQIGIAGYTPQLLGFDGTDLLIGRYRYSSGAVDSFIKRHPIASPNTQYAFAGVAGAASMAGVCVSGTALSSCVLPQMRGISASMGSLIWDPLRSAWIGMMYTAPGIYGSTDQRRLFQMAPGGNLTDLASLPTGTTAFAVRHDGSHNLIYYCSSNDKKLHKFDLDAAPGAEDSAYAWPVPKMECGSHTLIYDSVRDSLIFAYSVNGLWGIAEYLNP